jgi:hypothetical protein
VPSYFALQLKSIRNSPVSDRQVKQEVRKMEYRITTTVKTHVNDLFPEKTTPQTFDNLRITS